MSFGRIPTFVLNKLVKISCFSDLGQGLSLELGYWKNFKSDSFLHLVTQLLSMQNFFLLSAHRVEGLGSRGWPRVSEESSSLAFSPLFEWRTKKGWLYHFSMASIACSGGTLTLVLGRASAGRVHVLSFRGDFGEGGQFLAASVGWTGVSSWCVVAAGAAGSAGGRDLGCWAWACDGDLIFARGWVQVGRMALALSDVGLEAGDQGVLKCAWMVQVSCVVLFETKIHLCRVTIMRSVHYLGMLFLH